VKFQLLLFNVVTNQKFEIAIMCIIGVNMVGMAAEYHGQPDSVTSTLASRTSVFFFFCHVTHFCSLGPTRP